MFEDSEFGSDAQLGSDESIQLLNEATHDFSSLLFLADVKLTLHATSFRWIGWTDQTRRRIALHTFRFEGDLSEAFALQRIRSRNQFLRIRIRFS